MAFSPDGILFVTVPSTAGLYASNKSGGAVYAFPDLDRDGEADEARKVIVGLNNRPHGLAFHNGYLFLTEENAVSRYRYLGNGNLADRELVIGNLPFGADHVSRTIGFSPSGKMYVSVGSSCNLCQEYNNHKAAIV